MAEKACLKAAGVAAQENEPQRFALALKLLAHQHLIGVLVQVMDLGAVPGAGNKALHPFQNGGEKHVERALHHNDDAAVLLYLQLAGIAVGHEFMRRDDGLDLFLWPHGKRQDGRSARGKRWIRRTRIPFAMSLIVNSCIPLFERLQPLSGTLPETFPDPSVAYHTPTREEFARGFWQFRQIDLIELLFIVHLYGIKQSACHFVVIICGPAAVQTKNEKKIHILVILVRV